MVGKGSARRPGDEKNFRDNWEKIFGKKKQFNFYNFSFMTQSSFGLDVSRCGKFLKEVRYFMTIKYEKPTLSSFDGWDSMFAAGASFDPPDPGCFIPGLEDDCAETGAIDI